MIIAVNSLSKAGGGTLGTPLQTFCTINGYSISLLNEYVSPHTHGDSTYSSNIVTASLCVKINNIGIVRNNDLASCNHGVSINGPVFCTTV